MTARGRPQRAAAVSLHWEHPLVDEEWKKRAACRGEDPALWFPRGDQDAVRGGVPRSVRAMNKIAREICEICPVIDECLSYAIELDLRWGTWGGLTERDRARLTRRRPNS